MKLRLIVLLVLFGAALHAQEYHSYISDRRFITPEDLYDYDFKPNVKETIDGAKTKVSPGVYSFAYSGNYLYVNGRDIKGVYSVSNTVPTEYGYKMNLMNATP